jgi:murein DD-endopeptidase MepM/ murein hydrolase activator NlpD
VAAPRSPLRWLRVLAIVTVIALPAVAVSSVDASAGSRTAHHLAGPGADDMNQIRIAMNAVRTEELRAGASRAAARLAAAQRQRVSRRLARRALILRELTRPVYVRPVPGPITQWYGTHPGIDIAPPFGTPVGAAHSGVVTFVGWDDGYGMHVEVRQPDGFVTTYSHLSAFAVAVGQPVVAGQWLGAVGSTGYSTGPHLHFEVHVPGGARMDPAVWLRAHGVKV